MNRLKFCLLFFFFPILMFASDANPMVELMTNLVLQIGIILFAAKFGGMIFEKIKMPSVLGELVTGIIIGPFFLGSLSFPGFPQGLFPIHHVDFPITTELYGIATIASIILLFHAGLETDLGLFLQYSVAGSLVGIGGIVFSFIFGVLTGVYFLDIHFMDPMALFLGVMSTATSVGITARILSEKRKMDSPEGVTILAGAVIDDVLGIILLAIVLGIAGHKSDGEIAWSHIGLIAGKAIFVWLGFTFLGLFSASKVSKFLKRFKSKVQFSVLSFAIALIIAGIFEKAGLAMIIGAYVAGLTLSKTDISYVVQENLHSIQSLFVPIFFTVMGMLVNVKVLMSKDVIIFGVVYTIGAILAKLIGCGIPARFLNFNRHGVWRIGLGMVPRGEVALIIAGIGLSQGVLNEKIFGVAILMTLITTIIAPPLLSRALKDKRKGTIKELRNEEKAVSRWNFPTEDLTQLLLTNVLEYFQAEGYFINRIQVDSDIYHIRKNESFIQLYHNPKDIIVKTELKDVMFIRTIVYEALVKLHNMFGKLQQMAKPESMQKKLVSDKNATVKSKLAKYLDARNVIFDLKSNTKEQAIHELVNIMDRNGFLNDAKRVYDAVMIREKSMSTGYPNGIAIPHARTSGAKGVVIGIGVSKQGVDFAAMDKKKSHIIFLLLSTKEDSSPHIAVLADIAALLQKDDVKEGLLSAKSNSEIYNLIEES